MVLTVKKCTINDYFYKQCKYMWLLYKNKTQELQHIFVKVSIKYGYYKHHKLFAYLIIDIGIMFSVHRSISVILTAIDAIQWSSKSIYWEMSIFLRVHSLPHRQQKWRSINNNGHTLSAQGQKWNGPFQTRVGDANCSLYCNWTRKRVYVMQWGFCQ